MNTLTYTLRSRLRGTWIHRMVWDYKNPRPASDTRDKANASASNDRNAYYDWQTTKVMFRVLHRNSNCVDVGAHIGDILRQMTAIAPQGRHHAIEPLPHLSRKLAESFPRAVIHQVAISDQSGGSEFLFVENDPGYSGLRPRIYDRPDPKVTPLHVRVVTLDEIIPPDEKITFIKIDIEGGEFHAIKGGIQTIRRCRPVVVFEAGRKSTGQYGVKPEDLYRLMDETLGYELSTMERWLERRAAYNREEFCTNWNTGSEYYFIATPKNGLPPLSTRISNK
jgi:FkbM family methyltransferase